VLALEFLLSASPEFFDGKTQQEIMQWANTSTKWLKTELGTQNLVHVVMHQDEKTPHLVAYVVPEKDGRLNARSIVGTREMLSAMQTSYAKSVESFGLKRGLQGSKAEHTTTKEWYRHLNDAMAVVGEVEVDLPSPPPDLSVFTGPRARREALQAWQAGEHAQRKRLAHAAVAASEELGYVRRDLNQVQLENSKITDELIKMRRNLSAAYEAIGLGKEEIKALRLSNTTLVAQRLDYRGIIKPKENAIDLLQRVGGFDYGQAVAWLHSEFGPVITGSVVSTSAEQANIARPFTKAENAIKQAVQVQLEALDAPSYRITLISYDESQKPIVPGKRKNSEDERFYTKEEIIAMIPWLKYQNNQGMNVLVTPKDEDSHYILLDDCRLSASDLEQRGFKPCVLQQSSWDSTQAIFKVTKSIDRDAVIAVFNDLNKQYGDVNIKGLRHPFRLPGFRNMKPKHLREGLYPFVKVLSATNIVCQRCISLIKSAQRSNLLTYPQAHGTAKKMVI